MRRQATFTGTGTGPAGSAPCADRAAPRSDRPHGCARRGAPGSTGVLAVAARGRGLGGRGVRAGRDVSGATGAGRSAAGRRQEAPSGSRRGCWAASSVGPRWRTGRPANQSRAGPLHSTASPPRPAPRPGRRSAARSAGSAPRRWSARSARRGALQDEDPEHGRRRRAHGGDRQRRPACRRAPGSR